MKPSFITGCKSYKIDAITKHEESKINLRSREIKAQLQKPIKKSDAAKIVFIKQKQYRKFVQDMSCSRLKKSTYIRFSPKP